MIDQLPEHRPLPDDVRMRARQALDEGLAPRPGFRTPALLAAGVGVLVAGAVVAGQFLGGGSTPIASPPGMPSYPHNGEFEPKDLPQRFHLQTGVIDEETTARCGAAAKAHPPVARWTLVATTYQAGIRLSAFRVPQGLFFCATTATTTSVSEPSAATPAPGEKVRMLFNGPNGSMAGVTTTDVRFLQLLSAPGDINGASAIAVVNEGLFFAPRGFLGAEKGAFAKANGDDRQLTDIPAPAVPVVDRPKPPADRQSDAGRKLGECLLGKPYADADQFAPGVDTRLSPTTTLVVGTHNDRLVYCRTAAAPDTSASYVYDLDELTEWRGSSVGGHLVFYDFKAEPQGGMSSTDGALVGLVTNPAAASITYVRPGEADAPAVIAGGTFVITGRFLDVPQGAKIVIRDAAGALIEEIKHTPPR